MPKNRETLQPIRCMFNKAARTRKAMLPYTMNKEITKENLETSLRCSMKSVSRSSLPKKTLTFLWCRLLGPAMVEGAKRLEAQRIAVDAALGMMKLVLTGEPADAPERGVRSVYTYAIMNVAKSKSSSRRYIMGLF
ncbi:hypothetical protein GQ43DRAFT_470585 [Delitschia confertaspora ATCC 74209]|uniref:Uncharacterized protein n=1 Tax=Delitschia confertaspora ATCC 74209 TaxID=1513339 RepID=A0A9P4MRA9_9PLEO|nr:hypothetical protein GQ43DRAFT_470585 [Delitschia confertaspora ATCC 74209]